MRLQRIFVLVFRFFLCTWLPVNTAVLAQVEVSGSNYFEAAFTDSSDSELLDNYTELNAVYEGGKGIPYAASLVYETVSKGLAVFAATKGNVRDAIVVSVNFGRDTDCLAATAAGLAGAFSGTETIPREWIDQVEEGTRNNPYTNSHLTIRETAEGMFEALKTKVKKAGAYAEKMAPRL